MMSDIDPIRENTVKQAVMSLYLDDSGTRNPDHSPNQLGHDSWFALGGVLVWENDEILARQIHSRFCEDWSISYPLRSSEIRSRSKKFSWLGRLSKSDYTRFMTDLSDMLVRLPVIGHACVIDRSGYDARYRAIYGRRTWHLCQTSFAVLIERAAKLAKARGAKLRIYIEKGDKTADSKLESYYLALKADGMPFSGGGHTKYAPLHPSDFASILYDLKFKTKDCSLTQIADLDLYPICKAAYLPDYKPFRHLVDNNKIVDCTLAGGDAELLGVKYSCFDSAHTHKKAEAFTSA